TFRLACRCRSDARSGMLTLTPNLPLTCICEFSPMTPDDILALPFTTVPDLVRLHAREQPAHQALIQDERENTHGLARLDYAGLDALMDAIAARLQRDGLGEGESVAVCAANSIEYAALFLGVLRAGGVVAPLSPSSTPESLA